MSRKHNTKHNRGAGGYARRLLARGQSSASVRMPCFTDGAKKQQNEKVGRK